MTLKVDIGGSRCGTIQGFQQSVQGGRPYRALGLLSGQLPPPRPDSAEQPRGNAGRDARLGLRLGAVNCGPVTAEVRRHRERPLALEALEAFSRGHGHPPRQATADMQATRGDSAPQVGAVRLRLARCRSASTRAARQPVQQRTRGVAARSTSRHRISDRVRRCPGGGADRPGGACTGRAPLGP